MPGCYMGIDVGTGSARAGVFDAGGALLGVAKADIAVHRGPDVRVEQSSAEIWGAVCRASRQAVAAAGIEAAAVRGIGFDATCSLVVLDGGGRSLPVGSSGDPDRDVIVWLDHRALDQARRINETGHDVLRYVGGSISPEMQTPKLLWLKENMPDTFREAGHFLDLTDFLTWRATGSMARSLCTVTCKWTYLAHEKRWDDSYFDAVGLSELAEDGHARIGTEIVEPGTALGAGLIEDSARELGLTPGCAVAAGLIDAHAGGVGTVGADGGGGVAGNMGYVFGTSSCTMTSTADPVFVPGVWGPYYSVMVPGTWLNEGGQSAAGAAIDQLVSYHPAAAEARAMAEEAELSVVDWLTREAERRANSPAEAARLAWALLVVPEFLGNRSPFARPEARAVISGLGMERDLDSLVALYVAGLCGLGYGLRQILSAQAERGAAVDRIVISGGAGRAPLIRQILADATGTPVAATASDEPVLLGSAILGAVATGAHASVADAMPAMSRLSETYAPTGGAVAEWHAAKFDLFERFQALSWDAVQ
ncbi:FGGY-family pentulose kinase [Tranquillimonas rosea]|uniref:FGGY-family pentulose kinase n=1 Tax=Tranquillimonas rosea TaxID=641238 RepID=A0A1H9VDT7_9RHOB|nr:FGGY-family carbohydrate kinase [Tranquillimonas rosea]SES19738.1 FGGY-family pentulose kinase [Tranquillimonas rosea]